MPTNLQDINNVPGQFVDIGKDLKAKLQTSERDYLSQPWHFGFSPEMKGGGPEFAFLAALKVQILGRRLLFFSPYPDFPCVGFSNT